MTPLDVLAWCLYSPRRLALVVASLVVMGALTATTLNDRPEPNLDPALAVDRPQAGTARDVDVDTGTTTPTALSAPLDPAATEQPGRWSEVRNAAKAFLVGYLVPPGVSAQIRPHGYLRDLATPTLRRALSMTDRRAYPSGRLDSVEPVALGAYAAKVRVSLQDGRSLDLMLVRFGDGWRVGDVQPGASAP